MHWFQGDMIRYAALAALFLAAWAQTVQADFNQEVRRCDFGGGHPDIQIIACTRNIQSGRFTGRNLAQAFSSAVRYLCSPDAAYVTGQTLHVNGGRYLP